MPSSRPIAVLAAVAGCALGLGALFAPPAAAADPAASVTAAVAPAATPGEVTLTFAITISDAPTQATELDVTLPSTVRPDLASATLDGASLPARGDTAAPGSYTGVLAPSTDGVTAYLGTGLTSTTPTSGGELAVGAHTLTLTADAADARAAAAVSGTLRWTGGSASTAAVPLPLPDVVVGTPPGSGEDQTLPLGTGQSGLFAVLVSDRGTPSKTATLTVTLPPGLGIDPEVGVSRVTDTDDADAVPLHCTTTGQVVRCALGELGPEPQLIIVPVQALPSAPVGQVGTFTVSAASDTGLDADPTDNAVTGRVRFAGVAHLRATATAAPSTVTVGHSTTVTVGVRNTGPQPSVMTIGTVLVLDDDSNELDNTHFKVTGFTGKQIEGLGGGDPSGLGVIGSGSLVDSAAAVARSAARRTHAAGRRTAATSYQPLVLWDAGVVPAGGSTTARLTLKAETVGRSLVTIGVLSANSNDLLDCDDPDTCPALASVSLRAVAAPATTAPRHSPQAGGADPIAATGTPVGSLTLLGLLTLLAGALMVWLAALRLHRGRHRA